MRVVLRRISAFLIAITIALPVYAANEIKSSSWSEAIIKEASRNGYVPDDLLQKGDKPITREELCRLIMKFYSVYTGKEIKAEGKSPFTDASSPEITAAVNLGFVSGVGKDKFNPNGQATNEQLAVIMYKLINELSVPLEGVFESDDKFKDDASISQWAKDAVNVLKKNGYISGFDGNFNPQKAATVEQAIVILSKIPKSGADENKGKQETNQVQKPSAEQQSSSSGAADTKPTESSGTNAGESEKSEESGKADELEPIAEIFTIGDVSFTIGDNVEDVKSELGEPDRVDKNLYGFDRYIYNSDYSRFLMVGIENGKVAEIFTNSKGFKFANISDSTMYSSLFARKYVSLSSEKAVYHGDGFYYTVYFDAEENNKADSIHIIREGLEGDAKFYTAENEKYVENELFDMINSARVKHGLPVLIRNSASDGVAKEHSNEMNTLAKGSYTSKNGLTPFARMTNAGINFTMAAENICTTATGDAINIYGWFMNNISTRSNIVSDDFNEIGIGCSASKVLNRFYTTTDLFKG